jgi:plasmid stability protein
MPVTLSIKSVPDEIVERLRIQAKRHHRSLQGELSAILEQAVLETRLEPGRLTPLQAVAEIRCMGLTTPADSAAILREERDGR